MHCTKMVWVFHWRWSLLLAYISNIIRLLVCSVWKVSWRFQRLVTKLVSVGKGCMYIHVFSIRLCTDVAKHEIVNQTLIYFIAPGWYVSVNLIASGILNCPTGPNMNSLNRIVCISVQIRHPNMQSGNRVYISKIRTDSIWPQASQKPVKSFSIFGLKAWAQAQALGFGNLKLGPAWSPLLGQAWSGSNRLGLVWLWALSLAQHITKGEQNHSCWEGPA